MCKDYCKTQGMITIQQMQWLPYNRCNDFHPTNVQGLLQITGNDYCTTNVMITVQQM